MNEGTLSVQQSQDARVRPAGCSSRVLSSGFLAVWSDGKVLPTTDPPYTPRLGIAQEWKQKAKVRTALKDKQALVCQPNDISANLGPFVKGNFSGS